jgi:hypothetical protein
MLYKYMFHCVSDSIFLVSALTISIMHLFSELSNVIKNQHFQGYFWSFGNKTDS